MPPPRGRTGRPCGGLRRAVIRSRSAEGTSEFSSAFFPDARGHRLRAQAHESVNGTDDVGVADATHHAGDDNSIASCVHFVLPPARQDSTSTPIRNMPFGAAKTTQAGCCSARPTGLESYLVMGSAPTRSAARCATTWLHRSVPRMLRVVGRWGLEQHGPDSPRSRRSEWGFSRESLRVRGSSAR